MEYSLTANAIFQPSLTFPPDPPPVIYVVLPREFVPAPTAPLLPLLELLLLLLVLLLELLLELPLLELTLTLLDLLPPELTLTPREIRVMIMVEVLDRERGNVDG